MKASILHKLDGLQDRYQELTALLSDAEVIGNQERYRAYSREYAELEPVIQTYATYHQALATIDSARELLTESDAEMRDMAQEELRHGESERDRLAIELQQLLLPKDENDNRNVFLEVRAGTGGDEAAIFAGDLFRMYARYAEGRGWQVELLNERPGEHGGYKEVVARIAGNNVYANLKFESGAHRVQRVPATEAQGRIHTSACTVAVLPEVEVVEDVDINRADLRIDTFRASGAGGQHVNKTDSAIRITHLPTGVVVECQDERSQHKNRARAMSLLQSKLLSAAQNKQSEAQAAERKLQVGSGDRSERIRTYNFPQGRLTDHRINLTLYQLDDVMSGNLDPVIQPLLQEHQAEQLAELANG